MHCSVAADHVIPNAVAVHMKKPWSFYVVFL